MKGLFKASVFLAACLMAAACGQSVAGTPAQVPFPAATVTAIPSQTLFTATPLPSPTATATFSPTPTQDYVPPTLIPTLDPTLVPALLYNALSIQKIEGSNGHNVRRITGWDYGFRQKPCDGYQWLDSDHLLLYPRTGQWMNGFTGGWEDLGSEPVVANLDSGNLWLKPPWSTSTSERSCDSLYWSQELGILINQENSGSSSGLSKEAVHIYTLDGQTVAHYWGKILGVSPKGTKVLVDDDTIIDLGNNKIIDLAWYMDYDLELSPNLYWSLDETRVYRCCFYYADLRIGKSYNLEWSDLRGVDGKPIPFSLRSPHVGGQWVRNDTYFFPKWDYWSYAGDPAMIFSPTEKKYYVIKLPSPSSINPETKTYKISPDGMQVWITGFSEADGYHSFLIDLTTFATLAFDLPVSEFEWSPDSQFALLQTYSDATGDTHTYLLSVSNRKMEPVDWDFYTSWRPMDHILADLEEEGQVIAIFDAKDMSIKEWELPTTSGGLIWSPKGERIALVAKDGSLWQVDYPRFEHPEQLTGALATDLRKISWSPDGSSIAFISGSDIYVVDTMK